MDSLTQIVLGAAVAEAVGGRKIGNKAAMWGAIAGTIPDLDVFFMQFFHPIDAVLMHRGFSHSILFAVIAGPLLGYLVHLLYKKKYELKMWMWLFFLGIITHPMLDIFTNYGTEFLWPLDMRITFNTVFVVDPLYTVPFGIFLLIALFKRKEDPTRKKWNMTGIYYSCAYLLWGVIVKLVILNNSSEYFHASGLRTKNAMVTPMPLTSLYWMILTEDKNNFYVGYKSLFYPFQKSDIETIPKNHNRFNRFKWRGKNYNSQLKFITKGYYSVNGGTKHFDFHDLRFGTTTQLTAERLKQPMMGFRLFIDKGVVHKTRRLTPSRLFEYLNFEHYLKKIITHE